MNEFIPKNFIRSLVYYSSLLLNILRSMVLIG
jgi:hypothetical protein